MYNCCYGLKDHIDNVLTMIEDMAFKRPTFNKRGNAIPKGENNHSNYD